MTKEKLHNDFVISISAPNIDITNINIEEMQQYSQLRKRIACIVTEKKSYGELDKMNYQLVMNYTKPKVTVLNSKNKPYLDVLQYITDRLKKGLIIVESDTYSEAISDLLCNSPSVAKNDIDVMVCKSSLASLTENEMKRANLLRISADPNLDFMVFQKLNGFYEEKILSLMICQLFVNNQYEEFKNYINQQSEKYSQAGKTDFVDYYELNKQLAYFIYYDVVKNKVINIGRDTLKAFAGEIKKSGMFPIPDIESFVNAITI